MPVEYARADGDLDAMVGAVILTKMDGHSKGGGALSAVSATESPIIFIGTGEHMDDFEQFTTEPFVNKLLGRGDWKGFVNKLQDVIPKDQEAEFLEDAMKGQFTMKTLYEQFQNILKMGPMSQVMSMIPGFSNALFPKGHDQQSQSKLQRYMIIMDSMTNEELESTNIKMLNEPSRKLRLHRGSGRPMIEVQALLEEYRRLAKIFRCRFTKPQEGKTKTPTNLRQQIQQISKVIPPHVLQQMGGSDALKNLMKAMENK